jgi:hypothetical protein
MSPAVRYAIALVVGIVVAFGLVAAIESLGHRLFPPPKDVNWNDPNVLRDYVQRLPIGALLFVVAAWVIATFTGGFAAARIARARPMLFAGIVGGLVLCATIANLVMIPHPVWIAVTGLGGIVIATVAAGKLAAARG